MILVCAESLEGGLGAIVHEQVTELRLNHQVLVLAPNPNGRPWAEHWRLPRRLVSVGSVIAAWQLRQHVKNHNPKAIHFHGLRPAIVGLALRGRGRRIVTYHGSFEKADVGLMRAVILRLLPLTFDEAFSVSPPPPKWRHTPSLSPTARMNGGDPSHCSIEGRGLPSRVVWVGRLDKPKTPDKLIDALRIVRDRGLGFTAVLFGDGPVRRALEHQVHASGLDSHVTFAGHVVVQEMEMSAQDVFVLLSESEGVPLSMQEAMSAGCQVVVSPLKGTKWLGGSSVQFASSVGEVADAIESACSGRFVGDTRAQFLTRYAGTSAFETWHSAVCECRMYDAS